MGKMYEQRKEELKKLGEWSGDENSTFVRFVLGNWYKHLQNPSKSSSGYWNEHRWTMFVKLQDGQPGGTSKYIKSVTYHLDPGFTRSRIRVTEAPFNLTRNGWGVFEAEVDIEFHDWTKLPKMTGKIALPRGFPWR